MSRTIVTLPLCLGLLLCAACPAKVPTPTEAAAQAQPGDPQGVPVVDQADPRIVRDGDDLYVAESAPNPPPEPPALGSGRPDETNGVCRLFAPKLPNPECCPFETGFDAERIRMLCGHQLYMGESLFHSCGYFFLPDMSGSSPVAIRVVKIARDDVPAAVADHDQRIAKITKNPSFKSSPVPGVDGAMWSAAEDLHWAFLPGWSAVRVVSWTDDACPADKMPEVLKVIMMSKEPPPNAPRLGLVPIARE
jgi:hypothetical protein